MNREKEVKAYLEGKLSQAEKLKYEIADELGLFEKIEKSGNIKSKIQPEGTRRNDAGKVLRAVLNYKNIFLEKRNFFDGSGWTDQWKRAILLE